MNQSQSQNLMIPGLGSILSNQRVGSNSNSPKQCQNTVTNNSSTNSSSSLGGTTESKPYMNSVRGVEFGFSYTSYSPQDEMENSSSDISANGLKLSVYISGGGSERASPQEITILGGAVSTVNWNSSSLDSGPTETFFLQWNNKHPFDETYGIVVMKPPSLSPAGSAGATASATATKSKAKAGGKSTNSQPAWIAWYDVKTGGLDYVWTRK